jgi:uncharacterized iron-regulated protein
MFPYSLPIRRHPLRCLSLVVLCAALMTACANRPEAPIIPLLAGQAAFDTATRLDKLLPADVLLLGEQHDAAEHQQIEQQVVANLAQRGVLAAVALEMADAGTSTASLHPSSSDEQVQLALRWSDRAWPWSAYGPAVMTAVRAGVPVLGGNLPHNRMQDSMADSKLDVALPGPALKAQQQGIRTGHCNLLPETQITPMTRIQIAKDISMATTLSQAVVPGKVVVLLSGNGHADRFLGVPQHLGPDLKAKVIRLRAGPDAGDQASAFDMVWATPALPEKDYCAGLQEQFGSKGSPAAGVKP